MARKKYSYQKISYWANKILGTGAYTLAYSNRSKSEIRDIIGKNSFGIIENSGLNGYARSLVYDYATDIILSIKSTNSDNKLTNYQRSKIFQKENRYAKYYLSITEKDRFKFDKRPKKLKNKWVLMAETFSFNVVLEYVKLLNAKKSPYNYLSVLFPNGSSEDFDKNTISGLRTFLSTVYTRFKETGYLTPSEPGNRDKPIITNTAALLFLIYTNISEGGILVSLNSV